MEAEREAFDLQTLIGTAGLSAEQLRVLRDMVSGNINEIKDREKDKPTIKLEVIGEYLSENEVKKRLIDSWNEFMELDEGNFEQDLKKFTEFVNRHIPYAKVERHDRGGAVVKLKSTSGEKIFYIPVTKTFSLVQNFYEPLDQEKAWFTGRIDKVKDIAEINSAGSVVKKGAVEMKLFDARTGSTASKNKLKLGTSEVNPNPVDLPANLANVLNMSFVLGNDSAKKLEEIIAQKYPNAQISSNDYGVSVGIYTSEGKQYYYLPLGMSYINNSKFFDKADQDNERALGRIKRVIEAAQLNNNHEVVKKGIVEVSY